MPIVLGTHCNNRICQKYQQLIPRACEVHKRCQGKFMTESQKSDKSNHLIGKVVIKVAIIEEDECNGSGSGAADEEHHDGDGDQHQGPLLLVLQQGRLSLRPEKRLLGKCKQVTRHLFNVILSSKWFFYPLWFFRSTPAPGTSRSREILRNLRTIMVFKMARTTMGPNLLKI